MHHDIYKEFDCDHCGSSHDKSYLNMVKCRDYISEQSIDDYNINLLDQQNDPTIVKELDFNVYEELYRKAEKYDMFKDRIESVSTTYAVFYADVQQAIKEAEREKQCNRHYGKFGKKTLLRKLKKNYRVIVLSLIGFSLWTLYHHLRGKPVNGSTQKKSP